MLWLSYCGGGFSTGRPGLAHSVPIHEQQAPGAAPTKGFPGGSQQGPGAPGAFDGSGGPQAPQPGGPQQGFQQLTGWAGPQPFFTPQQGFPPRLPQQGFVAPQQRFMMPQQQPGLPQQFVPPQPGVYEQDAQGPQVAYARTFIPHKNLPRPGFATPQQVSQPGFIGPQSTPQMGQMPTPFGAQLPFVTPLEQTMPSTFSRADSIQQPLQSRPGAIQPQPLIGGQQPLQSYPASIQPQPTKVASVTPHVSPSAYKPHEQSLLAPESTNGETLPWRRPRSSSVQVPRKPPSPWAPASRDRSLDSQPAADEKAAQPWTKQNLKLKKAPRPKKSFEKEELGPIKLKPSKIQKRPIPREELEQVDLKPGQRAQKKSPEKEGIQLKPIPARDGKPDAPEESQLKPSKRQSRPRTRPGDERKSPICQQELSKQVPEPEYSTVEDDDHSVDRSLDGSLDRSIDESLDDDFWKPKVAPWSSEPVVLKKTQRKRKVFKKEELEEIHLKPAKIEKRRLSKPELEHVDLKPVPQEQMGILSWTEEEEASLLKIDRQEIENYKQRPRSRSRDLLSEGSEASDIKSVSEPIPWSHESLHLKKAPKLPKKEFPKETLEEVQLKPAVIERRQMTREELERVELQHVEKDGIGSWAEEDDSSMLKLDMEEIEMYKRRPRSRSRDLLDETSEADDTSMSLDLSLEDLLDNRKGPIPWTEEPIQLKRTPREHKEIAKETLEQVHLKPSKIERKEITKEQLEHVDLKPAEKIVKEVPKPEQVVLKPIPKPSRDTNVDRQTLQPFSETEDASLLSLDRKVDVVEMKKPRPDFLEMLNVQDSEHTDVPFFWKRGGRVPDIVEVPQARGEDSTVRELERTIRRLKEEESKELYVETEDSSKVTLGGSSVEHKKPKRQLPQEEKQPQVVPWTQESIQLKKAPREKREIPKETLGEVSLKPVQIESRAIMKESVETVSLKPIPKDVLEQEKPQKVTLKEIDRAEQSILGFAETDDSNLLTYEKREEIDQSKQKEETGVMWERGTRKKTKHIVSEVEDSSLLQVEKEETSSKESKEVAVMWQRGKRKNTVEKVTETDDTSILSINKREDTEQKQPDEVPVMWQRGKKKDTTEKLTETDDSTLLSLDKREELATKQPDEVAVMWQRGKKKTDAVKEPYQEVEDAQLIGVVKTVDEEKQPIKPRSVPEHPQEAIPWNQQPMQLKKTTREVKDVRKETVEAIVLKPSKPLRREIPKEEIEHVDLLPIQRQPTEDNVPENVQLKPIVKDEVLVETIKSADIDRKVSAKARVAPYSEVEDKTQLTVSQNEDIASKQEEQPVAWRRGKIPAENQPSEIQHMTEVEDATRLAISETEEELKVSEVPVMWERGKKKKPVEIPRSEVEDITILKVDEVEEKESNRKPRAQIPSTDSKEVPWNKEEIRLKRTPKQRTNESIASVEEVQLKPTRKQVAPEDSKSDTPVEKPEKFSEVVDIQPLVPDSPQEKKTRVRKERPKEESTDVPWTQEGVILKRTPKQPKESPQEKIEEVQLKPVTSHAEKTETGSPLVPETGTHMKTIESKSPIDLPTPETPGPSWQRAPKVQKPKEIADDVEIKRAPRRPKEPEEEKPEVQLKPIKQRPKEVAEQPEITLKPWGKRKEDTPHTPTSQPDVSVPHVDQVKLKPVKRKPSIEQPSEVPLEEETQPELPRNEAPKPDMQEIQTTSARHVTQPQEVLSQEEVQLKRTPKQRPKPEEEKEVVQLKPVRRDVKDEEVKDTVELKPITKKPSRKPSDDQTLTPVEKLAIVENKSESVKQKPTKRVTIKEPAEEIKEFEDVPELLEQTQETPQEPVPVAEEKPLRKPRRILPKEEQKPEQVTLKPVKRGPKPKEPEPEEVLLKPIPKLSPGGKPNEQSELKSISVERTTVDKPEEITEDVEIKRAPRRPREPEEEKSEVQLKPVEQVPKEAEEQPEVRPKPQPKAPLLPEETKDNTKPSWLRKRIRIPKPVPGRPEDEDQPTEHKPELVPEQLREELAEEVRGEVRSETVITLTNREMPVSKKSLVPEEIQDKEEQPIWQKQMTVETQSRRVTRRAGQFIQDETPLRDLEIVTAKRGVEKLPEEPVVEEEVREDRTAVRRSIVQRSTAEILAPQKTKPPKFTKRLEPVAAAPDSPCRFTCQVEGVPFPDLTWLYNGKELRASELVSMTVVENVVTLEIVKTLPQHVGVYSCKATNPAGVAMSTANLVILEKEESGVAPQFSQPLKPQVVKPRETATLRCLVKGEPAPIVRWYRGDTEVKTDSLRRLSYDQVTGTATMTILEPTPQDEVIYRVVATNKFGRAECRANLILGEQVSVSKPEILHAPRIVEPLKAILAVKGQPVVLAAGFQGTPQPEVRWYRNGKEIVPLAEKDKEIVTEAFRTELRIPAITKQHSGKYEVRAMNTAGEARTSGSVAVREHDADDLKDARAPRFIEPLEPQIVAEGECVVLEARVDSFPTCSFQWFLHSVPVKSSPELRVVTEENRSVLVVREVLPEHAGDYTCRAENAVGSVTSTATLSVVPEMQWETTAELEIMSPQFVKPVSSVKVMDGEKVTFTCQVVGKPTPRVTWRHNGQPIKEAKDVTIYQDQEGLCKLAISEVFPEDAGLYTCEALNRVGEAVCSASLIVEASVAVDTNLATAKSVSEEDLLEKESLSSLEDQEMQAAHFVTPLVHTTPSREGELVRLEVKAGGNPRPSVRWYKQGNEIHPNKDFQVENYEDGTSVLTIMEVFPDDVGEISCEVQNELGVDQTVTELEVHGILGTKEYRKPEWVTQMEELKDALKGTDQCARTRNPVCLSITSMSPEPSDQMSVDSLDMSSRSRLDQSRLNRRPGGHMASGSWASLGDLSIGSDSVFLSTGSSCSEESPYMSVHVPFILNQLPTQVDECSILCSSSFDEPALDGSSANFCGKLPDGKQLNSELREHLSNTSSKVLENRHNLEVFEDIALCNTRQTRASVADAQEIEVPMWEHLDLKEDRGCCTIEYSPEEAAEYTEVDDYNHRFLSTIMENSEPTSSSGSDTAADRPYSPPIVFAGRLLSSSCNALDINFQPLEAHIRCQTYPRSRVSTVGKDLRMHSCLRRTLYPLEPRELDPTGFQQLHTADSNDELQEFLLLESQCMHTNCNSEIHSNFVFQCDLYFGLISCFNVAAVQAVPSIEVEIRDAYVEELDTVVFECVYSGTPKPDIIWYHDDQIVRNTEKVRITIEESKTTCTVKCTSPEDAGIYVCKATSDIGMAITKAKLSVTEIPEERKEEKILKIAQEEEEKVKLEKVKLDKKREKKKRRPRWGLTDERDHASVEQVQTLESASQFTETVDSRRQSIQDSVAVSAVASCKKVDDSQRVEKPKDKAQQVLSPQEGLAVSETQPAHEAVDLLEDKKPKIRKAKPSEAEGLKDAKVTVVKVQEIIKKHRVMMAKEVNDIMELMNVREFGPGESPLRELAQIGFLVRHGVTVSDITSVYHETDEFPALRTPSAQSALVSLVEREGHGTLISQVLTEETTADETTVAKTVGFRAFMRMIQLRHVTVEEVLTHFSPEDFHMPVWETSEATKACSIWFVLRHIQRGNVLIGEYFFTGGDFEAKHRECFAPHRSLDCSSSGGGETLEEMETQTGMATKEHTPHARDEGVTISELHEDDYNIAETDTAIVTQPDDDYKHAEELDVPSQKTIEKGTKKKKVVKKLTTEKTDEEIEVNIEVIKGGVRKVVKTIRAQMPDESDEYINEDFTGTLQEETEAVLKGLPLYSTSAMAITMPSETPTEIGDELAVPQDKVKVSLLTHSAVAGQIVKCEERETDNDYVTTLSVRAAQNQEPLEPVSVTQPQVQVTPGEFDEVFKPQSYSASKTFVQSEGIVVSVTEAGQSTSAANEIVLDKQSAAMSLIPQEATTVTEVQTSDKEKSFDSGKSPIQLKAEKKFGVNESVSVLVVDDNIKEETLDSRATPGVKPKIGIPSNEPLIVSEVFLETRPEKYVPEVIVPTETATKSVIAQQSVTTDVLQAPETEGLFVPGRLPPSQQASQWVTPIETAVVTTPGVEEKESNLDILRTPEKIKAIESLATVESVLVSSTLSQDSETLLNVDAIEKRVVDIDVLLQESVLTSLTTTAEKEGTLSEETLPNMKHATASVSCLELSGVTLPVGLESEGDLVVPKGPLKAVAETSVREEESLGVTVVQTSDVPSEFSDVLKYRTDEAATVVALTEAAEVWEVQLHDKEQPLKTKEPLAPALGTPGYRHQFGVSIFEAQSGDKEEPLRVYDLPEAHKGKLTASQLASSLQIEEISPEAKTGELLADTPKTEKAHTETDTLSETVVQEIVVSEGILPQETPVVISKLADVLVTGREAVTKTEVFSEDKEAPIELAEKPKECFASADICGQTLPITSEVLLQDVAHDFNEDMPQTGSAKQQHSTVEGVVVCQSDLAEKEGDFPKLAMPDSKIALIQFPDEVSGLSVMDIQPHETESTLVPDDRPKPIFAEASVPAREIAIQSVVMPQNMTDELSSPSPVSSRAKTEQEPFSGLVVTETAVGEGERELPSHKQPGSHTASVVVGTMESFSLAEVETETKEDRFESPAAPKLRTALPGISGREVAQTEELLLNQHAIDWDRVSPIRETAKPEQDGLQIATMTETATGEKEGDCTTSVQPKGQNAGVAFENVAGQVLTVKEVNLAFKEGSLSSVEIPKEQRALVDIPSNEVAQTTEVIAHTEASAFSESKPVFLRAMPDQVPHETISVSVNQPVENESEFLPVTQPENKTAQSTFIEEIGLSVSLNTANEKEAVLPHFETPEGKTAAPYVSGHEIAQSSEVVPQATVDSFSVSAPVGVKASLDHISHQGIIFTETALAEIEGNLEDDSKPNSKVADIFYEEASQVQITETFPQDKETSFDSSENPLGKFAQPALSTHEVAVNTTVRLESSVLELQLQKELERKAVIDQIPFEAVVRAETTVQEKEEPYDRIAKTGQETATPVFEVKKSLNVTEALVEDSEAAFLPTSVPQPRGATVGVDLQEASVVSEVESQISLGDVSATSVPEACAQYGHIPFEGLSQTQATVQESELALDLGRQIKTNTATLELTELVGVEVTSIELSERENTLPEKEMPAAKVAVPDVTLKETAQQLLVVPETSTGELQDVKTLTTTASSSQQAHNYILTTQIPINEKEEEFVGDNLPEKRTADQDYVSQKGLLVSEVNLSEREELYKSPDAPKERRAVQDLTDAQDIAEKTEVLLETSIPEIPKEQRQEETGVQVQETLHSIEISENAAHELEVPFSGSFKPTTKTAGTLIEEAKSVQVVSEVQPGDSESTFQDWVAPKSRVAVPDVSGQDVAEKTEVLTEMCVGPVSHPSVAAVTATALQIPFESIVHTQAVLSEKEIEFKESPKVSSTTADMVFEEQTGIQVSEVRIEDREKHLDASERPRQREAQLDVTPREAAEVSAVYTQQSVDDITLLSPITVTARPDCDTFEGIQAIQPVIVEREQELLKSDDAKHTTASVSVRELGGVCVTVVESQDREEGLVHTQAPATKKANAEVLTKEVAQSYEVSANFLPSEVVLEETKQGFATYQQSLFESLTQEEAIVQETESCLSKEKTPASKTASLGFEEESSIRISEVQPEVKETDLETAAIPPSQIASSDIISQEGVVTTVVDSQMHSVQKDEPFVLQYENACTGQEPKEAISITERLVQEKEGNVANLVKPSSRNAEVSFEETQSTIVSETVIQQREEERSPEAKPRPAIARPEVTARDIAEQLEIVPHSGVDVLESIKPHEVHAAEIQSVVEALLQSEAISNERESNLVLKEKEMHKNARISIDVDQTAALSSEIVPEDKENTFVSTEKPTSQKAKIDLLGRDVAEQTAIEAIHSTDLITTTEPLKEKARFEQIPFESLMQSETSVHEFESTLESSRKPDTITADLQIQTGRSITVTEVIAQDNEGAELHKHAPRQEVARPDVCERETALQTVIVPESNLTPLEIDSLDTSIAKATLPIPAHGLLITEIGQAGEKEAELPSLAKPATKKIPFTVEERDSNLLVTEVHSEIREEPLDTLLPYPLVKAKQTTNDELHAQTTQTKQGKNVTETLHDQIPQADQKAIDTRQSTRDLDTEEERITETTSVTLQRKTSIQKNEDTDMQQTIKISTHEQKRPKQEQTKITETVSETQENGKIKRIKKKIVKKITADEE
ncbi:hypothetical protein FOCC_FOCC007206, partial [Frankliniella occidentalis]